MVANLCIQKYNVRECSDRNKQVFAHSCFWSFNLYFRNYFDFKNMSDFSKHSKDCTDVPKESLSHGSAWLSVYSLTWLGDFFGNRELSSFYRFDGLQSWFIYSSGDYTIIAGMGIGPEFSTRTGPRTRNAGPSWPVPAKTRPNAHLWIIAIWLLSIFWHCQSV